MSQQRRLTVPRRKGYCTFSWMYSRCLSRKDCCMTEISTTVTWWKPYSASRKIWGQGMGKEVSSVGRYAKNTAMKPIWVQKEQPGRFLPYSRLISQYSSCINCQRYQRKRNHTVWLVMKSPWSIFLVLKSKVHPHLFALKLRCSKWWKVKECLHNFNTWRARQAILKYPTGD